jgi:hypothetical protein
MLRAIPDRWFSRDLTVFDGERPVARVDLGGLREVTRIEIEEVRHKAYRSGWIGGDFLLEKEGEIVARAVKPAALRNRFVIEHQEQRYELKKGSAFGRRFVLREGGREVGEVFSEGGFSLTRKVRIDLPEELPLPVRVFVLWMVVTLWKRESDGAVASVAATSS